MVRREGDREEERDRETDREKAARAAAGIRGSATHPIFGRSASHATQSSIHNLTWPTLVISGGNQKGGGIGVPEPTAGQEPYCDPPAAPELEVSKFSRAGRRGEATGNSADGTADPQSTRPNHAHNARNAHGD